MVLKETHLPVAVRLVGELHFGEGNWLLHPVVSEVGGVAVDVDGGGGSHLGLASCHPLAVDVLPPVVVDLHELQQDGVHGGGVEAADAHLHHGEHAPEEERGILIKKENEIYTYYLGLHFRKADRRQGQSRQGSEEGVAEGGECKQTR